MKLYACCSLFFAMVSFGLFGQQKDVIATYKSYIENEAMIGENKLPAHASFTSYISEENAIAETPLYFKSLDGSWKFNWVRNPKDRPITFMDPKIDVTDWEDINVPSNWEVEGFGVPIYVNHQYEFADYKAMIADDMELIDTYYPKDPGNVPDSYNPVGSYRREFNIDKNWEDKEIFLHVGAMKAGGFVWLNGTYIGYSQGSKLPAEFNITNAAKPGKNTLAIQIFRWTDGSYLECQDFWRISGIERSVYVYGQPKLRIKDFEITSILDDAYKNGQFGLAITLKNHFNRDKKAILSYEIRDDSNAIVASGRKDVTVNKNGEVSSDFNATLQDVKQWSAEHPNVYILQLKVTTEKGELVEVSRTKIGFRSVEIKKGLLLVNGQRITLKGVNTQETDPETGHIMSEELMIKDIRLWKENNINAVRLSHYPRGRRFYELCDEYGIYVVDEANIESHGMYYGKYSLAKQPNWEKAHVERMTRMVARDRNHPSVIIWSMGNEGGNGVNFFKGYDAIKAHDNTKRPVQYERPYKEYDRSLYDMDTNTDIIVPQYPSPANFEEIGKSKTDRPYIPSEYAHGMGNSTGNFQDYWTIIEQYDNLQGGFIWDWVDQSIWKTNANGERFYAYGGDYGKDMPSDNSFLNNGIVFPDRSPQPALFEVKKAHEYINFKSKGINKHNELRVLIENLYDFTNLDQFQFTAKIKADGVVLETVVLDDISVETHTGKLVRIPLSEVSFKDNTEYFVELSAITKKKWGILPTGFEVAHEQITLPDTFIKVPSGIDFQSKLSIEKTGNAIAISSSQFKIVFDKDKGRLTSYIYQGKEFLMDEKGPKPNFWRAVTDNDFGNAMHTKSIGWKDASMNSKVTEVATKTLKNGAVLMTVTYELLIVKTTFVSTYEVSENGIIKVNNTLNSTTYQGDIPRIGMRMQLPKKHDELTYFGRGPWENYQDRNTAAFVDLYISKVRDQYVPYIRPQDNGYKTDVRWVSLSDEGHNGLLFVAEASSTLSFSALHMENEDFDTTHDLDYTNAIENKHTIDIKEKNLVQLNIDLGQRGVAGDDSWYSKPQEQYQYKGTEQYHYGFFIIPYVNKPNIDLVNISKMFRALPE